MNIEFAALATYTLIAFFIVSAVVFFLIGWPLYASGLALACAAVTGFNWWAAGL